MQITVINAPRPLHPSPSPHVMVHTYSARPPHSLRRAYASMHRRALASSDYSPRREKCEEFADLHLDLLPGIRPIDEIRGLSV